MNVYDQAHSLATAIKSRKNTSSMKRRKKIVEANPQLDETIKDFMRQQIEMQAAQMMGQEMDGERIQKMQQLSAILMQDPAAAQYLQCQMRFSMMMADVYKIIGDVADLGMGKMPGME